MTTRTEAPVELRDGTSRVVHVFEHVVAHDEIEGTVGELEFLDVDAVVSCPVWNEVAGHVPARLESEDLGLELRLGRDMENAHLRRVGQQVRGFDVQPEMSVA